MLHVVSAGFSVVSVTLASWLGQLGSLRYVGSSFYMVSCATVTSLHGIRKVPGTHKLFIVEQQTTLKLAEINSHPFICYSLYRHFGLGST